MGVPKDAGSRPMQSRKPGFAPFADIARIRRLCAPPAQAPPTPSFRCCCPLTASFAGITCACAPCGAMTAYPRTYRRCRAGRPCRAVFDYHHDLYHDVLTNAYNRRFFEKQLRKLMEVDAVAMLDLDQFKQINDVYGHQAGDDALRMLVSAVTACVRKPQRCTGAVRRRRVFADFSRISRSMSL